MGVQNLPKNVALLEWREKPLNIALGVLLVLVRRQVKSVVKLKNKFNACKNFRAKNPHNVGVRDTSKNEICRRDVCWTDC
jgi:hypothetical protein